MERVDRPVWMELGLRSKVSCNYDRSKRQYGTDAQCILVVCVQDPSTVHRPQIELAGVSALAATDYTKKPHVFRLKLGSGAEYLFHARDEVLSYVHVFNTVYTINVASLFEWLNFSVFTFGWAGYLEVSKVLSIN